MKKNIPGRLEKVQKVLVLTFVMNLIVCLTKIGLGLFTGVYAITADGLHSLGDSFSNVVGLIGIRLAKRKPDGKHGYGYERYEAVTTLLMVALMSVTCYAVFESGIARLLKPQEIGIQPVVLLIMAGSMAINVATIMYEGGAGRKLKSELLIADSNETKCDLWVSSGVIVSTFVISRTGWSWLDGAVTIAIGFLIIHVIWGVIKPAGQLLADRQVVEPVQVQAVVAAVPGAKFCHAIRSRGKEEDFFLDLHLGVDEDMTIKEAHDYVCHLVKRALRDAFPGLKSVLIHLEPDNEAGKKRKNSIFRDRDPYDHS